MEANALKFTLVIDVTSNVIEDPLGYTRVGEDGETILEKQSVSNKQHRLSIPAPYRKVSGLHALDSDPIVHIPPVGGLVPQLTVAVLKNGLRKDGGSSSGGDDGSGRRRHCNKKTKS